MTDTERFEKKKELRTMLLFDKVKVGTLTAIRVPGGIIYQEGTSSTFVPYDKTCAFDLAESKESND